MITPFTLDEKALAAVLTNGLLAAGKFNPETPDSAAESAAELYAKVLDQLRQRQPLDKTGAARTP